MSLIAIEGMEFFAYHGCFAEEQVIGTKFLVDFYLEVDTKKAEKSDKLNETINYQTVYSIIKKEMEIKSKLLENVARRALDAVMNEFPEIVEAEIKLEKLNPPLGGKMKSVSVSLSTVD